MSATTTHTSHPSNEAGFPPAPSEAHQKAYAKGNAREVGLNGTRIRMVFDGKQWWNVSVTPI
jgi:hypothetical protein